MNREFGSVSPALPATSEREHRDVGDGRPSWTGGTSRGFQNDTGTEGTER